MIKLKNLNGKKITVLLLSGIIIMSSGCSFKKSNSNEDSISYSVSRDNYELEKNNKESYKNSYESTNKEIVSKEDSTINSKIDELEKSESRIEESLESKTITKEDIINFLEKIDDKIMEKGYQIKDELIKDYGIVHDFIFENGTIKGYTFDELKDNTKAKIISIYLSIDEKIEKHYPEYKEIIKEKYGNVSSKVKNKLSSFKEKLTNYIKDEIGEEKYNKVIDTKDKVIDEFKSQTKKDISDLKELGGKVKEKFKSIINKN